MDHLEPPRRRRYTKKVRPQTDDSMAKFGPVKERKKKRERWLLTRKTWRYMADAGRRLVPEGHNRPEDVSRLEAYFQEVCEREPKFLLWRKQSYPGAFAFRKGRTWGGRKKGGSCRDRPAPGSADEADESGGGLLRVEHTAPGKFDLQKLRREFFSGKSEPEPPPPPPPKEEAILLDALYSYLYRQHPVGNLDHEKLIDRLREHLAAEQERRRPAPVEYEGDMVQRNLLETLRRYFGKSPNRQKVISDLLTDRKKLERLYFDLRQRRGFMPARRGAPSRYSGGPASPPVRDVGPGTQRELRQHRKDLEASFEFSVPPASPPLILEETTGSRGTQTESIADHSWVAVTEEAKRLRAAQEAAEEEARSPPPGHGRRSSVDNDDVSPSVSDTIKRYLRMARKKSVDSDKADRFKRVNYDRNLRNIKAKGELSKISDDDGLDKGAQTDESWIEALRELKLDTLDQSAPASSRSSLTEDPVSPTSPKSLLSSGHSFLSNLLHGRHPDRSVSAGGMQKSKSSTSVVQQGSRLVAKKIWKTRSKSQSRATPSATSAWTPQGGCRWTNVAGRVVTLADTSLPQLTELERLVLQKVALAKLQALNLGVNIKIPSESCGAAVVQKPKRRAYLLKRKAITTSVFDTSRKDDKDKGSGTGLVFGVALGQCVESERARACPRGEPEDLDLRRKSHHGSRGSFSSLFEAPTPHQGGSCESLMSPTLSMPGLDSLSCGSTQNLVGAPAEGGVPNIVTSCLTHLRNHGLNTLGIFRVSSSKKRVRQLREEFDCGKEMSLEEELCPHDVATLLKEYFRDLPDPLLCKHLYHAFIQTQRIRNRRLQHEAVQHLIQLLPLANRDTLLALLDFLALVASKAADYKDESGEWISGNKMDSNNLATLFAPNLLHPCPTNKSISTKEELSSERVEERSDAINVIRCLIDNHTTLFQVSAELLDEVYLNMMDTHPEALDQLLRRRDTSADELDDTSTSSAVGDVERKVWSREACTHEAAGMGGPDFEMRPRGRLERGRERLSRRRREELSRIRVESESSSRRTSSADEKTRVSSSDSGRHTPDENNSNDGVITASLKIPVPPVTSFSLNLDDIPYIEDNEKQHITLGLMKSASCQPVTSESGVGSWGSTPTSPTGGPDGDVATATVITFPPKQQAVLQKVTIKSTSEIQQVQPSFTRSESYSATDRRSLHQQHQHLLNTDKIPKSASTSTMVQQLHETPQRNIVVTSPSITSIGGAVLRSKTADIERMIRLQANKSSLKKTSASVSTAAVEKETTNRRRYVDSRHLTRHLPSTDQSSTSQSVTSSVRSSESRSVWKRHELISSEPKDRKSFF